MYLLRQPGGAKPQQNLKSWRLDVDVVTAEANTTLANVTRTASPSIGVGGMTGDAGKASCWVSNDANCGAIELFDKVEDQWKSQA